MGAIANDWLEPLKPEFAKPYYAQLYKKVKEEYTTHQIFPPSDMIFHAFEVTPLEDVKVVILGQDPYHQPNQAHGMCFSVRKGVKVPPSLVNIYKELHDDLGCTIPHHGYLMKWAQQGVFLMNTVLTVEDSKPLSHRGKGWEEFTDEVMRKLNDHPDPLVFILWGRNAQDKGRWITNPKHLILKSPHPSPLSASYGFFGTHPFSKANQFLIDQGRTPIDWQIED